jgi:hypothetical protein
MITVIGNTPESLFMLASGGLAAESAEIYISSYLTF